MFSYSTAQIKDQCECLVKLIETMESAKYTIKQAVQAVQELDFGEDTCSLNRYLKKMENNERGKAGNLTGSVYFNILSPQLLL